MASFIFKEVLNDLMDYFLLSDLNNLLAYKSEQHLSDDLIHEFTTNQSGDDVVQQGVMIALAGIDNLPYTILVKTENEKSEFTAQQHRLIHCQSGYVLQVKHKQIRLFTMPYLKKFTALTLDKIEQLKAVKINLENGWYTVNIYAGFLQISGEEQACIEFILEHVDQQPLFQANIQYMYHLEN